MNLLTALKRNAWLILASIFLILAWSGTVSAQPPVYIVTDLGVLPNQPGSIGQSVFATGINNKGQVIGNSIISKTGNTTIQRAFIWSNSVMTDLTPNLPEIGTQADSINNNGEVAGLAPVSIGSGCAGNPRSGTVVVWQNGVMTDLSTPNNLQACFLQAYVNDLGQVIGWQQLPNCCGGPIENIFLFDTNGALINTGLLSASHINNKAQVSGTICATNLNACAALWRNGVIADLGLGTGSKATDVNDFGQAVGFSQFQGATHGFLWENGEVTHLGTLGGASSVATAINAFGQIVGPSDTSDNKNHGFLYSDGTMIDLNDQIFDPDWELGTATGINDAGQIVGNGTHSGETRGYLLTPFSGISPNHGGNTGNVTATIAFSGVQADTIVKLTAPGQPDIVGGNTTIPKADFLQVTFDLTGATPGIRNVVITQSDNTSITLPGTFTIEQGGTPQVWVDILGRNTVEGGIPTMYNILYGNRGNVDIDGPVTVWIAFPKFFTFDLASGLIPSTSGETAEGNMLISVSILGLPIGRTGVIPLKLTAPNSPDFRHKPFQIRVWTNTNQILFSSSP